MPRELLAAAGLTGLVLAGCTSQVEQRADGPVPAPGAGAVAAFVPARNAAMDARLIAAADRGDIDAVRRAHLRGASVRARDPQGRTALIAAAYGNHLRVARFLLEAGADPNAKDETVQSAYLISTAEVGDDPRLLNLTIANGAIINSKDSFNGTGLIRAADRGYPRVVARLLREDIDIDHVNRLGWTALHEAIILGDGSRLAALPEGRALARGCGSGREPALCHRRDHTVAARRVPRVHADGAGIALGWREVIGAVGGGSGRLGAVRGGWVPVRGGWLEVVLLVSETTRGFANEDNNL